MPYIRAAAREYFNKMLEELHHCAIADSGELNYLITELILNYHVNHRKCYQTMNDVVGALESAKAEYQRRIVGPYEDHKIVENTDVYTEEVLK